MFAGIGLLAAVAKSGDWLFRATGVNTALLAWLAALVLSLPAALVWSGPATAAASTARVGLFAISALVFFSVSQGPDRTSAPEALNLTRAIYFMGLGAAVFGCLDFFVQLPAPAGYGPQFVWLDSGVYRRAQGLFYESSTLGNMCAFFLVMAAAALSDREVRARIGSIWLWTGAVVFTAALIASYSRASVLTVVIGLGSLIVIERKRWLNLRVVGGCALALAAAMALVVAAFPEFAQSYWDRIAFSFENAGLRPDRVLSGRVGSWTAIAAFIADHPFRVLAGTGYKTLPSTVIADNMYVSALVETGLAGLLSLLGLNAAIMIACWRASRGFFGRWMFCFWTGEVVQMLSGDILTYWRVVPIYFWVLAQAVSENSDADTRA
jgi:O-antigen ligase